MFLQNATTHSQTVSSFLIIVFKLSLVCTYLPTYFCLFGVLFCVHICLFEAGSLRFLGLSWELVSSTESWDNTHSPRDFFKILPAFEGELRSSCPLGKYFPGWPFLQSFNSVFLLIELMWSQEEPAQKWLTSPTYRQSGHNVWHPCTQGIVWMPTWEAKFYLLARLMSNEKQKQKHLLFPH